jgi:hypothetical protein
LQRRRQCDFLPQPANDGAAGNGTGITAVKRMKTRYRKQALRSSSVFRALVHDKKTQKAQHGHTRLDFASQKIQVSTNWLAN